MNTKKKVLAVCCRIIILFLVLRSTAVAQTAGKIDEAYKPDDLQLYNTIMQQDSLFFHAYNTCSENLELYANYYSDSLEFYHDKSGLSTSKKAMVDATKKNICGKVTRELVKQSVEVYPIKDFGAIEIGYHLFHNKAEPTAVPHPGRFVIIWKQQGTTWKITRVISLH